MPVTNLGVQDCSLNTNLSHGPFEVMTAGLNEMVIEAVKIKNHSNSTSFELVVKVKKSFCINICEDIV